MTAGETVVVVGFGGFTAVPPGDSESPTAVRPAAGGVGPTITTGAGATAAVVVGAIVVGAVVVGAVLGAAVLAGAVPDGAVAGLTVSADGVPNCGTFVLAAGDVGGRIGAGDVVLLLT